jgi:hypothetical protein
MEYLQWAVTGLGSIALIGVFWKMNSGFGPFNLRAVGHCIDILALRWAHAETLAAMISLAMVNCVLSSIYCNGGEREHKSGSSRSRSSQVSSG